MPKPGILIVETEYGFCWKSARGDARGEISSKESNEAAERLGEFAIQHRLNKRECVLWVASSSVLFATFKKDLANATKDRGGLRYRLETELPVDAENTIADYSIGTDHVSAVAILRSQWQPFIDAVEALGIEIQYIVPQTVARLQSAVENGTLRPDSISLWINDSDIELVTLKQGRLAHWRYLPHDQRRLAAEICFAADASEATQPTAVDVRDLRRDQNDGKTTQWLTEIPLAVEFYDAEADAQSDAFLTIQADRYLARKSEPWFQLRRDELASHGPWRTFRAEIRRAVLASCLALICFLSACWWQAIRYDNLAEREDDRIREVYQQTLPGKRVPAAVLTGMRIAKRNLAGVGSASKEIEPPIPAMNVLRRLIAATPDQIPIDVNQIRIDNARFVLDVDVATIEDAGKLAAALQDAGVLVSPPSTTASKSGRVNARVEGIAMTNDLAKDHNREPSP